LEDSGTRKTMLDCVTILPPSDNFEVNSQSWGNLDIQGIGFGFGFGFSCNRAMQLDRNGLGRMEGMWDFENNQFLTIIETGRKFKLYHGECRTL
jgi:hypothetical protein